MTRMLVLLVTGVLLAGCRGETEATGLPQERFIEVVVELRKASRGLQDSTEFAVRKQQILEQAGVTEAQLREFVTAHQRDLDHMAAVWESINVKLAAPEGS